MSNETTTEHKSSLADIKAGDTIISIRKTLHGPYYKTHVVTKVDRTKVFVGEDAFFKKNGYPVGAGDNKLSAYAPDQIVYPFHTDKKTALQLMEEHNAYVNAKRDRRDSIRYITENVDKLTDEKLAAIVALINS